MHPPPYGVISKTFYLTHYSPVLLFYTPWKHHKTFRFSDVFKRHRKATLGCNGLIKNLFHIEIFRKSRIMMAIWNLDGFTLREMCPYSEFFWSVFSRNQTEYGEIRNVSPYSVQMRKNTDQKNSEYRYFSRSVQCFMKSILFHESVILQDRKHFLKLFQGEVVYLILSGCFSCWVLFGQNGFPCLIAFKNSYLVFKIGQSASFPKKSSYLEIQYCSLSQDTFIGFSFQSREQNGLILYAGTNVSFCNPLET